jgi:hypothetical protein
LGVAEKRFQAMGAARRITISLPEQIVLAAGETAAWQGCSRSQPIRNTLEWHLCLQTLPISERIPEELAALAAGRAQHARGEFATLDEIRRQLVAQERRIVGEFDR